ncbi:MAG TPA: YicC/YloC family endoribonuclease [Terriglobales bacterium]|nr:YicC/YloC family endoribonuclease [Terriglobales bacterium]
MRSMTGYGQAITTQGKRSFTVEVRAVNQRFLEVKLNMPREYLPWEAELRSLVQESVGRGKLDVSVGRGGHDASQPQVEPNLELAEAYLRAWTELQKKLALPGEIDISFLLSRPDVMRISEQRSDPAQDIPALRSALAKALEVFNRDREREGKVLGRDMLNRTRRLQQIQKEIAKLANSLKPQIEARMRQRLDTLLDGREIKEERLLQEVALIADRSDVTEEIVRLGSHLQTLASLLKSSDQIGKKLDFLLQEVHREFNTIAAKSNELTVTNLTMEAKAEIEKLREQSQNIE